MGLGGSFRPQADKEIEMGISTHIAILRVFILNFTKIYYKIKFVVTYERKLSCPFGKRKII